MKQMNRTLIFLSYYLSVYIRICILVLDYAKESVLTGLYQKMSMGKLLSDAFLNINKVL